MGGGETKGPQHLCQHLHVPVCRAREAIACLRPSRSSSAELGVGESELDWSSYCEWENWYIPSAGS